MDSDSLHSLRVIQMSDNLSRRKFLKLASGAVISFAALGLSGCGSDSAQSTGSTVKAASKTTGEVSNMAKVYFTNDITSESLIKLYSKINEGITGKVAIKLHSGEPHGPNLLPIELIRSLQATIPNSTIVECNVAYGSPRRNTDTHLATLKTNGFDFCPVDIMDAEGDIDLPVPKVGRETRLESVPVGAHINNYDSMLVYTHFKGHMMGGFGGSLKNIAIGCASKTGKLVVHGKGWPIGKPFLERMVESGYAIANHFKGHITYINVLKNLSVDCDCDANGAKPTMGDIGILASTDLLAIDQASIDLVYAASDSKDLINRIESKEGLHQLDYMEALGVGTRKYDLIEL